MTLFDYALGAVAVVLVVGVIGQAMRHGRIKQVLEIIRIQGEASGSQIIKIAPWLFNERNVHPLLRRLERRGYITHRGKFATGSNPHDQARIVYSLTTKGREFLRG